MIPRMSNMRNFRFYLLIISIFFFLIISIGCQPSSPPLKETPTPPHSNTPPPGNDVSDAKYVSGAINTSTPQISSQPANVRSGLNLMGSAAPKYRVDLKNTGRSPEEGPEKPIILWKFKAGGKIVKPPVIDTKGNIYFGSNDSHFYAVTPSGKLIWKKKLDEWVDSTAAISSDGSIYVGCDDGNLVKFSAKGDILWKYDLRAEISSSPTIYRGIIYVGSEDGYLYGLTPEGKIKLKFKAGGRILVSSPLITKEGDIVVGSEDYYIYAIKPDGKVRWKYKTKEEESFTSPPISAKDGTIYFATPDARIVWLDPNGKKSGDVKLHEEIFAPMALNSRDFLFAAALDGVLISVKKDRVVWKSWIDRKISGGPVIDSKDKLYFCSKSALYIYEMNGKKIGALKIKGDKLLTSPVIGPGKKIYIGAESGNLYCISDE